jgi:hypothetical protein
MCAVAGRTRAGGALAFSRLRRLLDFVLLTLVLFVHDGYGLIVVLFFVFELRTRTPFTSANAADSRVLHSFSLRR